MSSVRLELNAGQIVHETIDGETIVIHLGTGTYYSLEGPAADVWALIEAGRACAEIVATMCARYADSTPQAQERVGRFLDQLQEEDLVVTATGRASRALELELPVCAGRRLESIELEKFTDMREFMLVDPVHDVDAQAGWPTVKVV